MEKQIFSEQYSHLINSDAAYRVLDKERLHHEWLTTEKRPNPWLYISEKMDAEALNEELHNNAYKTESHTPVAAKVLVGKNRSEYFRLKEEFGEQELYNLEEYKSPYIEDCKTVKATRESLNTFYCLFLEEAKGETHVVPEEDLSPKDIAKLMINDLRNIDRDTKDKLIKYFIDYDFSMLLTVVAGDYSSRQKIVKKQFDDEIEKLYKEEVDQPEPAAQPEQDKSTPETLSNLIAHDKAPEIVEGIKNKYRDQKGAELKMLLLALQELGLFPKGRVQSKFHRCCKNEFDWNIGSLEGIRKKECGSIQDKKDLQTHINFIENIINDS